MDKQFPKVVVGCFILNEKNEILLVRSYKWADKWVVMGGHVEWGETIAEAVAREAKEEVGLEVKFTKVIEVVEFVFDPGFHDKKHMIALQSECHVVGDLTPKIDNNEIQEAKYFSLTDAIELPDILDVTKKTIQKIIAEK
jgi:nucleoside triphosphatase